MSNSSSGVFDSTQTHDYFFTVSDRVYVVVQVAFWFRFREFWAPATTVVSGGSSTPTTSSGGSSTPTSSAEAAHRHRMLRWVSDTDPGGTARTYAASLDTVLTNETGVRAQTGSGQDLYTYDAAGAHSHTVDVPAHQHTVDVPGHTHDLAFGIYKEPMPASINVNVGLWRKPFTGGTWELFGSITGLTDTEEYLDLTSWFRDDPSGLWRFTFQSAAGQPNGGRLTVDVAHEAWGAIKSA